MIGMRGNNPMFRLKLHVLVNILVNSRRICTKPSQSRVNFSRRLEWGVTTNVLTKTACFSQYLGEFLTELPQTTTNHDMDHYKWWYESSQITINHHKFTMTKITTNHKLLQITINHDINHHEPWQKPAQSMTWITTNHHKPWHEPSWWPKKSST